MYLAFSAVSASKEKCLARQCHHYVASKLEQWDAQTLYVETATGVPA